MLRNDEMRLYLVRHGVAEFGSIISGNDDDRALTPVGVEIIRKEARSLRAVEYVPEVIVCSPLKRARQTAEILAKSFGSGVILETASAFAPGGDRPSQFREILKYMQTTRSLMLVGHLPSIGELAGELASDHPDRYFRLEEGGICIIDLKNYRGKLRGTLVAFLPPSLVLELETAK